MRLRGAKVELQEAGEDTDGMVTSVSTLQEKLLALSHGKVDILSDANTFKNTTEILREMSDAWGEMTDMERAASLELMGGKRQANILASIIKNYDTVDEVIETSINSQNSAYEENAKWLDSIEGKTTQFSNALQTMWSSEISSKFVKDIVDIGTAIIQVIDELGLLTSAAIVFGGVLAGKKFLPLIFTSLTKSIKESVAASTGSAIATDKDTAAKLKNAIQSSGVSKAVQDEAIKRTLSTNALGQETVAIEANTKAKLKNQLADAGIADTNVVNGIVNAVPTSGASKAANVAEAAAETAENMSEVGVATNAATGVFGKFGAVATKVLKSVVGFLSTSLGVATAAIGVVGILLTVLALTSPSFKKSRDKLKETSDELDEVKTNLESLNSELETTKDRIDELASKDKLSFVEKEELELLRAQNDELERSIQIEKDKEKILNEKAVNDATAMISQDQRLTYSARMNPGSYITGGEVQEETRSTSEESVDLVNSQKDILYAEKGLYKQRFQAYEAYEEATDDVAKESAKKQIDALDGQIEEQENILSAYVESAKNKIAGLSEDYAGITYQYGEDLAPWQEESNAMRAQIDDVINSLSIASATTAEESVNAFEAAFKNVSIRPGFEDQLKKIQETAGITAKELEEMYNGSDAADTSGMHAFIDSLVKSGFIADATAESLQKVVDASIVMSDSTSEAAVANKKLARSQKMLEYYKLYKQLREYTKGLKDAAGKTKTLTNEQKAEIKTIKDKMAALADEISKYDLLGDKIAEVKARFEDFENAKTADSESDYRDNVSEMFSAIMGGFQSAELGSETFSAALASMVPESVYSDLDTLEAKYDAIYEYVNKGLSAYVTVEYDDNGAVENAEITSQNVENFLKKASDLSLIHFDELTGIWAIDDKDFSDFAQKIGMTEDLVYALGEQVDKMNAERGLGSTESFFDGFAEDAETKIMKAISLSQELELQLANGEIKVDEYTAKSVEYMNAMSSSTAGAMEQIRKYTEENNTVTALTADLDEAKQKLAELQASGASDTEIQLQTGQVTTLLTQLGEAIQAREEIGQPVQVVVEFLSDNIDEQIATIQSQWSNTKFELPVETDPEKLKSDLIEFTDDEYKVKVGLEGLSEEDMDTLNRYTELLNDKNSLSIYLEGGEEVQSELDAQKQSVEELQTLLESLKAEVDISAASAAIDTLEAELSSIPDEDVTVTVTTVHEDVYENAGTDSATPTGESTKPKKGGGRVEGTAHAAGNWGLDHKEKNALVGELGQEAVVDPRTGNYYTVGDNGAEFVDLPKDAIIFNHKQTEELFKNGHINSRGKAYANGNAYAGGTILKKYTTPTGYAGSAAEFADSLDSASDALADAEDEIDDIAQERLDAINKISKAYENQIGMFSALNDQIQSNIDLLQENGERISPSFYNDMISNTKSEIDIMFKQRDAMQTELNNAVASGDFAKYSEEWYEVANSINDIVKNIIDAETQIEEFENEIQNIHWDNFEKLIDAISAVADEAEQLRDTIGDEKIADEIGNWTTDGITAIGLVAQQMENAQYQSKLYAEEIKYLNEEFKKGNYSQDQYDEKLRDLKDSQWDAIDAYESAKKSIIDLNKTRVDAVKDGIQKEITAYEELINKRKEDIASQKTQHDWAKTIQDNTDEINKVQKQIDAMAGDTSAAANARRKQLQEELAEAENTLRETYYDKEIETQQTAMDKSLEIYKDGQEKKMEDLDAYLEQEDQVVADSYALAADNHSSVYDNIQAIAQKYGIELENGVVAPWTSGVDAIGVYITELNTASSAYVDMLEGIKQKMIELQKEADKTAQELLKTTTTSAKKVSNTGGSSYSGGSSSSYSPNVQTGQQVTVSSSATNFARDGGNGTKMQSWIPGNTFTVMETSGDNVLIGMNGGYTGWVKKKDLQGYASGTAGLKKDQLAWIDENGLEEIVMHADGGKLAYMTKGSAVIPHNISENLMQLGSVDPRTWLDRNKPSGAPSDIVSNTTTVDMSFGSMINIEHADKDSIPEINDAVKKQLDSYMKNINSGIKRYAR